MSGLVARARMRRGLGQTLLVCWFGVLTMLSAGMLARHLLAMPVPSKSARLGHRMLDLRSGPPTWLAVHVLSSECPCSLRVVGHLLESVRPPGWSEIVLWVGDLAPPRELVARFAVRRITATELARDGIEAAPLLIAVTPAGEVRYTGGYTDRKQGPVFRDIEILERARDAIDIPSIPLFGCATSERLQEALAHLPTL